MFLVASCNCLCPIHWNQVLSREWRCSWSSADRWCSNYIWVIGNFIAYLGASCIWGLRVSQCNGCWCPGSLCHHVISSHAITGYICSCLPWGRISTTVVINIKKKEIKWFLHISWNKSSPTRVKYLVNFAFTLFQPSHAPGWCILCASLGCEDSDFTSWRINIAFQTNVIGFN